VSIRLQPEDDAPRSIAGESDGAAARWSLDRGVLFWTVIAVIDPVVAGIALILWLHQLRKR
jgi:hypothetical protein